MVPLIKVLEEELGRERAHALVRKAIHDPFRDRVRKYGAEQGLDPIAAVKKGMAESSAGDALDYETLADSSDRYDFDVKGCRYADLYRKLGEPEIGYLLVCSQDHAAADGWGDCLEFKRTQTIMQGAQVCDFRFRRHG
jgi:hypothetical protein